MLITDNLQNIFDLGPPSIEFLREVKKHDATTGARGSVAAPNIPENVVDATPLDMAPPIMDNEPDLEQFVANIPCEIPG